jgi:penicillin amidase
VTANNRVVTAIPDTGDYFCTDTHPPYRARRIEQLITALGPASPQDMAAIHRDDLSAPARLFQAALADVRPAGAAARAVRDIVLGWDARMSPGSNGAAGYARLRWALARIVAARSGLAAAGPRQLPGSVSAVSHLWWVLPALLRSNDLAFTGGSTWGELLAEALEEISGEPADIPWQRLHTAALTHPLTPLLPGAPPALSPPGAGVGGDNETVWANGCRAESGTAAVYGAVARYVFDVGNWDNCTWIVPGGASGDPASPHYTDQHQAWSRCELIPMRYDWDTIAADPQLTLEPGAGLRLWADAVTTCGVGGGRRAGRLGGGPAGGR